MSFGLTPRVLAEVRSVFSDFPQIQKVILYGSRAMGNYRNGSDIDLTFKGKDLNLKILNQVENRLDDLLSPYSFDLSILEKIENQELLDHIERAGVEFYKR